MTARPVSLRARRDFRLLWIGQTISQLGSRAYGVAYMLWVLAVTGSPTQAGLIASTMLGAFTAAQLPAGWLADRCDRRRIMIACDTASAAAALSVAGAAAKGWFSLGHLLAAGAVFGVGWGVRGTAEMTSLAQVVPEDELDAAVSLVQTRSYATGLAGPPLGGHLFGFAPFLPFLVDGISFVAALVCTAGVRTPLRSDTPTRRSSSPLTEVRAGAKVFWRHRFVRATTCLSAVNDFVINALGLCVIVLLRDAGITPATTGLILGMGMAGGLIGALLAPAIQRRSPTDRTLLVAGLTGGAVAILSLAAMADTVSIGFAYASLFLLQPAWQALIQSRLLTLVDEEFRGRVQSAAGLATAVPLVAVPITAGLVIDALGARHTCLLLAAIMIALAAAASVNRALGPKPPRDRPCRCLHASRTRVSCCRALRPHAVRPRPRSRRS